MTTCELPDTLKQLGIFIVCLAIFGVIVALILYFGVDLPARQVGVIPLNVRL